MRQGGDVTLVASGYIAGRCVAAAEALASQGIDLRLISMSTIKPIDRDILLEAARETGAFVTAEDHSVIGAWLASQYPVPMETIGLKDTFAQTGPDAETLMDASGLGVEDIVSAVKRALHRKTEPYKESYSHR
jgi:transketolase